ncbi:MAG: DUF2252 domain-containing protein, partial [Cyanobacteriota bacterium]|nr:DUF2252 domain-containing protein [Cyanobacteriota bacterium]
TMTSIADRLKTFNQGRDPERLAMKYRAMAKDPFAFFRGTCHLFYEDWPRTSPLDATPAAWICGDLHLENFGSYKGNNRLVYFDINDFDETALAPAAWDLARILASLWTARKGFNLDKDQAHSLSRIFIDAYTAELRAGKARWLERATAEGMIRDLLKGLKNRSRKSLIEQRTEPGGKRLRIDGQRTLPADAASHAKVRALLALVDEVHERANFFNVLDVARRIAGVGSLGLERFVILVDGRGGTEGHFLMDLKIQPGSSLKPYLTLPQPPWSNEAERVVAAQCHGQAIAPAFVAPVADAGRSYVLRELMPSSDSLTLLNWKGKISRLEIVLSAMGRLVAWSHMRASGWKGAAILDEWIAFGHNKGWHDQVLEYGRTYAKQVKKDWQEFREALDRKVMA